MSRSSSSRSSLVFVVVVVGGCGTAATDPPAVRAPAPSGPIVIEPYGYDALSSAEHDEVCVQTGEPPSVDTCTADSDCRICHDGSPCGTPASVSTLRARGAACAQADSAECESAAVRCCAGHCRVVSH